MTTDGIGKTVVWELLLELLDKRLADVGFLNSGRRKMVSITAYVGRKGGPCRNPRKLGVPRCYDIFKSVAVRLKGASYARSVSTNRADIDHASTELDKGTAACGHQREKIKKRKKGDNTDRLMGMSRSAM